MRIEATIEAALFQKFLKAYPHTMDKSINVYRDRVGYTLENSSKKIAPAITGNLRRQIFYSRSANDGANATLYAYADYAKYVHGKPYYENRMKRRETPFFTRAIRNNRTFIRDEQRALMKRVLK